MMSGFERIGALNDGLNAVERHPGIAGMKVGDCRDLELQPGGPSRRRNVIPRDAKLQHGFAEPVSRGRDAKRAQPTDDLKK